MKRVLVADDHAVTRRGLRDLLRELYPQARVDEAAEGHEVLRRLTEAHYDFALIDVLMPGPGIVALLRALRRSHPALPVLALTASTEIGYVGECLAAGANGLVHKHQADSELAEAIERVRQGGQYLQSATAQALVAAELPDRAATSAPHLALSPRELDVFCRIARGQAIKEIAFDLAVSGKTIGTYLSRIRLKTGLTSPVDMARYALMHQLVR